MVNMERACPIMLTIHMWQQLWLLSPRLNTCYKAPLYIQHFDWKCQCIWKPEENNKNITQSLFSYRLTSCMRERRGKKNIRVKLLISALDETELLDREEMTEQEKIWNNDYSGKMTLKLERTYRSLKPFPYQGRIYTSSGMSRNNPGRIYTSSNK